MKRFLYPAAVLVLALSTVHPAAAEPVWGGNCLSCHGDLLSETIFVIGEDTTADPDESGTGAPDRGTLKVFQAGPGQGRTLFATVAGLDPGDTYAVELRRLGFKGVEAGGTLSYEPDCDWAQWGQGAGHYTDPFVAYRWGTGPADFAFDIDVNPETPHDYYDLILAVAGRFKDGGGLFYAEEHFYLQVTDVAAPGDLDEDGDVDLTDFASFGSCLSGPGVTEPPGGCAPATFQDADIDNDDDVDLEDFSYFAEAFTG